MYSKLFGMYSGLVWDVYRAFWCFPFRFLMAFLKGFVVVGHFLHLCVTNIVGQKKGKIYPQQQSNAAENDEEGTDDEKHEEDEDDVEDK